jgi:hypothetical protein
MPTGIPIRERSGSWACTKCGETKQITEFATLRSRPSGHRQPCKTCNVIQSGLSETRRPEALQRRMERQAKAYRQLRREVLDAYGNSCACCGEPIPEFLTVDHVNNDGAEHRRQIGARSLHLYKWLKANAFPKTGFQLLCFNCNCSKGFNGECPHKRRFHAAA